MKYSEKVVIVAPSYRGSEEVPTTVKLLVAYEPQIGLVDECSGV
jgi:hypothetical protein